MKKLVMFSLCLVSIFTLASCQEKEIEITAESEITMENLDLFLFRNDVQYVDLRNFESVFKYGYIEGFINIPFFDYLDYRAFNRGRTYEFNPDQLLDTSLLEKLFDREKAIFLYADGCIRSGYIKDALNYLGYERVFVLGGYYDYLGENVITGSGFYSIGNTFYTSYTNPTTLNRYVMYGDYDVANNISYVKFDILDENDISIRLNLTELDSQLTIIEKHLTNEIYNFNEVMEDLEDDQSILYNLEGINWDTLVDLVSLLSIESIS